MDKAEKIYIALTVFQIIVILLITVMLTRVINKKPDNQPIRIIYQIEKQ